MSDVPGHDRVDAELAAFRSATPPPLAPAGAIRARGEQRRRHAMAATAGAATLSVVAIAAVALAAGGPGPVDPPVTTQPPAPTTSATPTTSPTTSPTGSPAPPASPTAAAGPAEFRLLTEALLDPADLPFGEWKQDSSGRELRAAPFTSCGEKNDPAEAQQERGVWRTLRPVEPSGEYVVEGGAVSHDVHAYRSAAAAAEAEIGYRRAVAACRTYVEEAPDGSRYEVTYTVLQQQPLLVERTYRSPKGEPLGMYPDYLGLARYDDVVTLLTMSFGEGADRDGARQVLAAAARETCDARRPGGPCA